MTLPTTTSLTLLDRVRAGDQTGWRRLFEVYGPFLLGRLRRTGLNDADADDVLQEVLKSVAASIGEFRRDQPKDSFLRWLQTITTNKLRDFQRQRRRQPPAVGGSSNHQALDEIADPFAGQDWSTEALAKQTVLMHALQVMQTEFEERTWRAFWLTVIERKTVPEICETLGMSPGAVRQARSKVRKRLQKELQDFGMLDSETKEPND